MAIPQTDRELLAHIDGTGAMQAFLDKPQTGPLTTEDRHEFLLAAFSGRAALYRHNEHSIAKGTTPLFDRTLAQLWSSHARGGGAGIEGCFKEAAAKDITTKLLPTVDPNNAPDVFLFCNAVMNVDPTWPGEWGQEDVPHPLSKANNDYVYGHRREIFEQAAQQAKGTLLGDVCEAAIHSRKVGMATFMYVF